MDSELRRFVIEANELDRNPEPDRVYQGLQATGIGVATIAAGRALPGLGLVIGILCIGLICSKALEARYGDRRNWAEVAIISTVLLAIVLLGFADKFSDKGRKNDTSPQVERRNL